MAGGSGADGGDVVTTVLSPAEQDEVTRFGIHDRDVITDMEKRLDTPPSCESRERCERPATVVLRHRCCGLTELVCGPCLAEAREHVATHPKAVYWCLVQFAPPVSFDDMITVVSL